MGHLFVRVPIFQLVIFVQCLHFRDTIFPLLVTCTASGHSYSVG